MHFFFIFATVNKTLLSYDKTIWVMRKSFLLLLLAAMFTMVSCEMDKTQSLGEVENVDKSENDDVIDNNENREIDPFIQSLQGTWHTYTLIHYDSEWKDIEAVLMENGSSDLDGIAGSYYTFAMDGTLTYSSHILYPPFGTKEWWTFPCTYDQEREIIALINDKGETLQEFRVYGYDGEYLTLDYTEHLYQSYTDKHTYRYVRETLKKGQE